MTKFLSEALQAPEPFFRLGIKRLEATNGHPGSDIRLSTEVMRATKAKVHELGLDPHDTTAAELYHVLQERVKADDMRLTKTLRTRAATYISAEGDVVSGMIHALKELPDSKRCFALKASVARAIIKKLPPKRAMKQLGYRSLDSFLKHETPVSMLVAASLTESASWRQRLLDQYKHLQPGDFEERQISLVYMNSQKWQELAKDAAARNKHNLISLPELGALVFLPLSADAPAGSVIASLSLALHELNQLRAHSTFLKLSQVRGDFGDTVQSVMAGEPYVRSEILEQALPWHLAQRYYARLTHHFREEAFGPHLQLEDMVWYPIEKALSSIEPRLAFWEQTSHLGMLHQRRPISFNIVDAALNYCNKLPFEQRIANYFQRSLWYELLLRYLRPESIEQAVLGELQPQLATEAITV